MPSIQFLCTACQRALQVDESQKGGQAVCPACGAQMTVPTEVVDASLQSTPKAAASPILTASVVGGNPFNSPQYYPPAPPRQETESFAIVSFVCSLVPIMCIGPILGIIFGHIAMGRIRESGGRLGGKGLATAGLVIGYVWLVLSVVFGIFYLCIYIFMVANLFDMVERMHEREMQHRDQQVQEQEIDDITIDDGIPVPVLEPNMPWFKEEVKESGSEASPGEADKPGEDLPSIEEGDPPLKSDLPLTGRDDPFEEVP